MMQIFNLFNHFVDTRRYSVKIMNSPFLLFTLNTFEDLSQIHNFSHCQTVAWRFWFKKVLKSYAKLTESICDRPCLRRVTDRLDTFLIMLSSFILVDVVGNVLVGFLWKFIGFVWWCSCAPTYCGMFLRLLSSEENIHYWFWNGFTWIFCSFH